MGGLSSALSAVAASRPMLWISWPGLTTADTGQQAEIESLLAGQHNGLPVFIPPRLFERYYHGFSNSALWPLFHYFPRTARCEASEWLAYRAVNQLFAQRVLQAARPNDIIWVHDYHLMLLPAMLRDDETDEYMFEALGPAAWSVRVGQNLHSRARYYFDRPDEARQLLKEMVDDP